MQAFSTNSSCVKFIKQNFNAVARETILSYFSCFVKLDLPCIFRYNGKQKEGAVMIKTIALDYGRVLARPRSGSWFFPRHTLRLLGPGNYLRFVFARRRKKAAQHEAGRLLDDVRTEQEEFEQFCAFYRMIFSACGITKNLEQTCRALAQFTVYNPRKVKLFRDVLPGIAALKRQYRVVIISQTHGRRCTTCCNAMAWRWMT